MCCACIFVCVRYFNLLYAHSDVEKIQAGFGDHFAILVQYASTFCFEFIVAFLIDWKLTLVILVVLPMMMITEGLFAKVCVCVKFKIKIQL